MIQIVSQDGIHQYDKDGNAITTWNDRYCEWIINSDYENETIDWQPDENGITEFPRGVTLAHAKYMQPNADNYPDITVTWYWDKDGYIKQFKENPQTVFYSTTKCWKYLDYTKEKAIKQLGTYCDFNKYAHRTRVDYNGETIFDGKLD